jgi:hypothetical protein
MSVCWSSRRGCLPLERSPPVFHEVERDAAHGGDGDQFGGLRFLLAALAPFDRLSVEAEPAG